MYIQIMIIDSDLSAAKQLKYYLQNETVRAYYTTSIEEGIRHLAHFCYQIVVMDVSSWEADGLKQLKRIQALVSVSILALSMINTSDHIVEILTLRTISYKSLLICLCCKNTCVTPQEQKSGASI